MLGGALEDYCTCWVCSLKFSGYLHIFRHLLGVGSSAWQMAYFFPDEIAIPFLAVFVLVPVGVIKLRGNPVLTLPVDY